MNLDVSFPILDKGADQAKMIALFNKIYEYIESGYTSNKKTKNMMRKYFLSFFIHKNLSN